jgi:hexosaminidase
MGGPITLGPGHHPHFVCCRPGHASSMCHAYSALCSPLPGCGWGPNSPLTPVPDSQGRNASLDAIQSVLHDITSLSPDQIIHLGGDEVHQGCWQNDSAVQAWMVDHGMGNDTDLVYEYFVSRRTMHVDCLAR